MISRVGHGLLLPRRLAPGDMVAIAAPSGSVRYPDRLERGVEALRRMGFRVVVGPVAGARCAGSTEERAEELNAFLRDPQVRGIVAAIGGYTSNFLLDRVDWTALRADPKILAGYSDITALLVGAIVAAGVTSFHGPTLLPEFAEYPEPLGFTAQHFLRATTGAEPLGVIEPVMHWTEEFLAWGEKDTRPRELVPARPWHWLGAGHGTGPLVGGNLETLCALAGTPYFPDFRGSVVLLESAGTSHDAIERDVQHLAMLGVFKDMAGLVFGHSFRVGQDFEDELIRRLERRFLPVGAPAVVGVHVGHTDPMPTLPLGVRFNIDADAHRLEALDAAVH